MPAFLQSRGAGIRVDTDTAMSSHSVRSVADAVAGFLAAHPACADTTQGILQWWLRPQGMNPSMEVTARALELLEMEQLIERRPVGSGEIWRLRRPAD